MTQDRWKEVQETLRNQFEIEYEGEEEMVPGPGTMEVMEFEGPMGFMRVEYSSRPRTLGRKVSGSRRSNAQQHEQMIYDASDVVHHMSVHTWNDDEEKWVPVEAPLFE